MKKQDYLIYIYNYTDKHINLVTGEESKVKHFINNSINVAG